MARALWKAVSSSIGLSPRAMRAACRRHSRFVSWRRTWSHIIDNGNFTTFINLPQNQFDNKNERANSNQDVRHRFVANFNAEAPEHSFLRNFAFSSIIT